MPRLLVSLMAAAALVAPSAAPASAQEGDKSVPVFELSGGYGFVHDFDLEENMPVGWYVGTTGNLTRWLGVVGEVTGNHKTLHEPTGVATAKVTLLTGMGGARVFSKQGRFVPYGQFLLGAAHARASVSSSILSMKASDTNFAIQPGGGVLMYFHSRVGAQVAADYRIIDPANADNRTKEFRFVTGVVVGFGGR